MHSLLIILLRALQVVVVAYASASIVDFPLFHCALLRCALDYSNAWHRSLLAPTALCFASNGSLERLLRRAVPSACILRSCAVHSSHSLHSVACQPDVCSLLVMNCLCMLLCFSVRHLPFSVLNTIIGARALLSHCLHAHSAYLHLCACVYGISSCIRCFGFLKTFLAQNPRNTVPCWLIDCPGYLGAS